METFCLQTLFLVFFLCICFVDGTFYMNIYKFSNSNYCTNLQSFPINYQRYIPKFGPVKNVPIESAGYYYEGTRLNDTDCCFCPYHQYPEVFDPEWLSSGGFRRIPQPMYGPCFNGAPSEKINCIQDQSFFPPEFCGEYFFPDQKDDPTLFTTDLGESFPIHQYLMSTSNAVDSLIGTNPKLPTNYGIGRGNVLSKIQSISIKYTANNTEDVVRTAQFQALFLNDPISGAERWLLWAQYFCSPACHRNSQYRNVYVRPQDYQNKSASLSYLSRRGSGPNNALWLVQCKQCPSYHAAYTWLTFSDLTEQPERVKGNIIANDCYPWFGAIPTLNTMQGEPLFEITTASHFDSNGVNLDGVLNPRENYYIASEPCPPDTYNDVCAHSLRYLAKGEPLHKIQCKPCPAGYHTEGKSGAWYCLPPTGNVFVRSDLMRLFLNADNQSLIWSRRDVLGYEFECGYLPSHCHQCSSVAGASGYTPDQFNQQIILKNVLAAVECKSGFFCPHPLQEAVACPQAFPWSPPGSFSVLNCSCAKTTFLSSGTCMPCHGMDACGVGFYMAGWRRCMQRDGATDGGVCVPCLNKPDNGTYIGGPGFEGGVPPVYTGICSFKCDVGYWLRASGNVESYCLKGYTCDALLPGQLKDRLSRPVYYSGLNQLQDTFRAEYRAGLTEMCTLDSPLTAAVSNALDGGWPRLSEYCRLANSTLCSADKACVVVEEAAYDRDVTCRLCPRAAPANGSFTLLALAGATSKELRNQMCSVQCNGGSLGGYYFNSSSYQCLLCADLERAVCASGYNIRGQGCMGDFSPFNQENLSSSCTMCPISIGDVPPGKYLDLQAAGGCKIESCPPVVVPANWYISIGCFGYVRGNILSQCTTSGQCGGSQYLDGLCTSVTTGVCKNCTSFKKGYWRKAVCGATEDSRWEMCGIADNGQPNPGYYCPGGGNTLLCPNGQTSGFGAGDIADCYCPTGTVQDGLGHCTPFQCSDTTLAAIAPGINSKSYYYMDLDAGKRTECYPCGNLAFTVGGGVGFGSCTCPLNTYRVEFGAKNLSCVSCNAAFTQQEKSTCASANGGSVYNVPSVCWRGNSVAGCQCALQPFNMPSVIGCNTRSDTPCLSGFDFVPGSVNPILSEVSSGSAMYIERSTSIGGWIPLYSGSDAQVVDYTISKMVVTSNKDGSGSINAIQYVLWTIRDYTRAFTIFTAPLPPNLFYGYNPYAGGRPWQFDCAADTSSYSLEDISVARWLLQPTTTTTVAAVVRFNNLLFLYLKQLTVGGDLTVSWGPEETTCGIGVRLPVAVRAPENSSVSCTTHAYASPVASLPLASTFYV